MCFSASASFGASVVLGAIGVVTLTKVKEPAQVPFAVIPMLFAVQQLSEGLLWMGLSDPGQGSWENYPIYIFLVFAQLIWPVWIPFSVLLLEEVRFRRRILAVLMTVGFSLSAYLLYCIFNYDVTAEIVSGHIRYTLSFPIELAALSSVLYFLSTVVSLFISGVKRMPVLGTAILLSLILTRLFLVDYFISVWCFFAALLSLAILFIISGLNNQGRHPVSLIV